MVRSSRECGRDCKSLRTQVPDVEITGHHQLNGEYWRKNTFIGDHTILAFRSPRRERLENQRPRDLRRTLRPVSRSSRASSGRNPLSSNLKQAGKGRKRSLRRSSSENEGDILISYTDVLGDIRQRAKTDERELVIRGLRKTRDGDLFVEQEIVDLGNISVLVTGSGNGFVWMTSGGFNFFSFYLTPHQPIANFRPMAYSLYVEIRNIADWVFVRNDVYARSMRNSPYPESLDDDGRNQSIGGRLKLRNYGEDVLVSEELRSECQMLITRRPGVNYVQP
ncbi:hypothetical protein J6590_087309 [Homalodisca vitripennis]|nr:hypothetical protein J6590_087309 [Homalodisca vitripennis]